MGTSETSAKIIGTCVISVGMNSPDHNPTINNVNFKALGGQEHLLGNAWVCSHGHFGDKYHWECLHLGGVPAPRLPESAWVCK